MKQDSPHYIDALLSLRRNTVEVLALAFVLAFGVNMASSGLPIELGLSSRMTALIGIALILIGTAFLAYRLKPLNRRELRLEGILVLGDDKRVEEIDRYELSERLAKYFTGIAAENKAIAKLWRESKLRPNVSDDGRTARLSKSHANLLVLEAIEYFVLDKLSLHLSAYFDSERDVEEHTVVRVNRVDIPQILLQNRFLELFSKPMDMREAFMESEGNKDQDRVVYATGKDGAFFDHFELILPPKSRVTRSSDSGIQIETSRFKIAFTPEFHGMSALLPNRFEELYMGRKFNELDLYSVKLRVKVEFKRLAFLTGTGWDYYEWLDSFLDELASDFSIDDFSRRISWESAVSVAIAHERLLARTAKSAG